MLSPNEVAAIEEEHRFCREELKLLDGKTDQVSRTRIAFVRNRKEELERQYKNRNTQPNNADFVYSEGPTEWPGC